MTPFQKSMFTLFAAMVFTVAANIAHAQQVSIGADWLQFGADFTDNTESAFVAAQYDAPIYSVLHARFQAGVAATEYTEARFVEIDNTRTYKREGMTDQQFRVSFQPAIMVGVNLPLDERLKLGIFTGYRSRISNSISHGFVPIAVSLSF